MSEQTQETPTIPTPDQWTRDAAGLLSFVKYEKNADGSINWRKMVNPEFLVVNKQNFERQQKPVPTSTEGLEDKDLLILLGGIKELARLRGYTSVEHRPVTSGPNYCSVRTTITWLPNFETGGVAVTFDALADASHQNTSGFTKNYLAAIAENRGFVRAVRSFLGINVTGQDEVGPATDDEGSDSNGNPSKFLEDLLSRNNISFEKFKNKMLKLQKEEILNIKDVENIAEWESFKDVPADKVWEFADTVRKILDESKKKKEH